jgi:hypothetical protein
LAGFRLLPYGSWETDFDYGSIGRGFKTLRAHHVLFRAEGGSTVRRFVIGAPAVGTAWITSGRTVEPESEPEREREPEPEPEPSRAEPSQ